jgi:ribose 5-phosphate isomerase B
MSIAANKVAGARAALVSEPYSARMAREHNDANIVVIGARVIGPEMIRAVIEVFAATPFTPGDDGRHGRRVAKLNQVP